MQIADPNGKTLFLEWGEDLVLNQNGSLMMATGWDQIKQRIIRRILTNCTMRLQDGTPVLAGYIFDKDYGLSTRRLLGEPHDTSYRKKLEQKLTQGVKVDNGVDPSRPPIIQFSLEQGGHVIWAEITVFPKVGEPGKISLGFE